MYNWVVIMTSMGDHDLYVPTDDNDVKVLEIMMC